MDMEGVLAITFIFGGGTLFLLSLSPVGQGAGGADQGPGRPRGAGSRSCWPRSTRFAAGCGGAARADGFRGAAARSASRNQGRSGPASESRPGADHHRHRHRRRGRPPGSSAAPWAEALARRIGGPASGQRRSGPRDRRSPRAGGGAGGAAGVYRAGAAAGAAAGRARPGRPVMIMQAVPPVPPVPPVPTFDPNLVLSSGNLTDLVADRAAGADRRHHHSLAPRASVRAAPGRARRSGCGAPGRRGAGAAAPGRGRRAPGAGGGAGGAPRFRRASARSGIACTSIDSAGAAMRERGSADWDGRGPAPHPDRRRRIGGHHG